MQREAKLALRCAHNSRQGFRPSGAWAHYDLSKTQWALHASIVASKFNRGEMNGARLGIMGARSVRITRVSVGWRDAMSVWSKVRVRWKAYQQTWPADGLRAYMDALELRLARRDNLASWHA